MTDEESKSYSLSVRLTGDSHPKLLAILAHYKPQAKQIGSEVSLNGIIRRLIDAEHERLGLGETKAEP